MNVSAGIRLSLALLIVSAGTWTDARAQIRPDEAEIEPDAPLRGKDAALDARAISVSADGRYLIDGAGAPLLVLGDAAWSLIANTTLDEAEAYLSDRQSKGFNAILVNLLEHRFASRAPANRAGDQPFLAPGDFSTPNEDYFAAADEIIDLAASKGMTVFLDVMYLGAGGEEQGLWKDLTSAVNSREVCFGFGRFLGERFHEKSNVIFVIGGDFTPPANSEGEARLRSIVEGAKAAGAPQLWTAHWSDWSAPLATDVDAFANLVDLQSVYPLSPAVDHDCARGYSREPILPTFLLEAGYEEEAWKPGDAASIRQYQWSALLGGCTAGVFYGHRDVWAFATDSWNSGLGFGSGHWKRALDAPGAIAMKHLGELLGTLPWHTLVPGPRSGASFFARLADAIAWYSLEPGDGATRKPLVASGIRNAASASRVLAAASADGRYLLAYRPNSHAGAFSVDMTALSGAVTARWWDPTNGAFVDIGTALPNVGVRAFAAPERNAAGDRDWLLLLVASPSDPSRAAPRIG